MAAATVGLALLYQTIGIAAASLSVRVCYVLCVCARAVCVYVGFCACENAGSCGGRATVARPFLQLITIMRRLSCACVSVCLCACVLVCLCVLVCACVLVCVRFALLLL